MAKIEPFHSLHYNPQAIEDLTKVFCPPYDVIDAKAQEEYYQKHPYNFIRLILGKEMAGDTLEENKYTRAAGYLQEWSRRAILTQDAEPSIYFYEQIFACEGRSKRRVGFMALMCLEEIDSDRSIHPHEHTHTAPKEDRLQLLKAVEANLSPIFTIFSDEKKLIREVFDNGMETQTPEIKVVDRDGVENSIWRLTEKETIERIKTYMSGKDVFIADGHHRYEVARVFRDEKRRGAPEAFKESYNYLLTYFTPMKDDGLCILPTHRLVKNGHFSPEDFSRCFSVKECDSSEQLKGEMAARKDEVGVFGLYKEGKFYLLKISEKRECNRMIPGGSKEYKKLDVAILHKVLFEQILNIGLQQINYEVSWERALAAVDSKTFDAVFLLNPTRIEQIRDLAVAGEVMPQKSTYFTPKLLSGLAIHKF
ncbi:MAG: DUF1015 domain-containing protein [Candidatus Omnitrophota bacterium]